MSFYTKLLALRTAVDELLEELDDQPPAPAEVLVMEKKAEEERDPPESQ